MTTPYLQALADAMTAIGAMPDALILGQSVRDGGTVMHRTFAGVPRDRLIEMPVAEEMQLGMSIGLSLQGHWPIVSCYPRYNFLILAANQLVNHLDALPLFSDYRPRVIIRVAVASSDHLDPGPQHLGDFSSALRSMLRTVEVLELGDHTTVAPTYDYALRAEHSCIVVERMDRYFDE
jgi:pyruvate/2-oxoglutarate/acetoin dehydrogenase E1 component